MTKEEINKKIFELQSEEEIINFVKERLKELEINSGTYAFKSPVVNSAQGSYLAAQNGNAPIYIDRNRTPEEGKGDVPEGDCGLMNLEKGTGKTYKIKIANGSRRNYYLCSTEKQDLGSYFDVQARRWESTT